MNRVIAAPHSPHAVAATFAVLAALAAAAAILALAPATASARIAPCARGEFCLYYFNSLQGGRYHFSGSDSDLRNDRFEDGPGTRVTVADSAESVWNNGRASANGHDDVAVYTEPRFHGRAGCIRLGQRGDLRSGFVNSVASYRWISPATCNTLKPAIVLPGGPRS